jgi:NAD(P)-dependent dehydrogenase (short-subunit alcohol dehydrogenase family)
VHVCRNLCARRLSRGSARTQRRFSGKDLRRARSNCRSMRLLGDRHFRLGTGQESLSSCAERIGPISLLICNAGRGARRGSFLDISPEEFLKNLHGQAFGPFLCAKQAIPEMLTHEGGTIAYIGATSSVRGYARSSAFATANSRYAH